MFRPPLDRTKRSGSLRKLTEQKLAVYPISQQKGGEVSIKRIVDEVLKYLIDIIEMLLLEENSNNYATFLEKVQEMNEENQKKMLLVIDEKLEQFKVETIAMPTKIKKVEQSVSKLKNQRKNITQSILQCHRSNSSLTLQAQKSAELLKATSQQANKVEENPAEEQENEKTMVTSELHSISVRLSEVEQTHKNDMRELCSSLEKKMEQAFRDIQGLTDKHINFQLNFEQKLETNLQALWNVVSDIRTDMAR